jgi:enterochelin esterase-like enzyme
MHLSFVHTGTAPQTRAPATATTSTVSLWARLQAGLAGWAYAAEDGRDQRIDLLRGLAVLAMIVDHLAGPSRLYLITGGNHFYTSAAEGFIFLSGLTVGLVYRRIAERQGLAVGIRRLLARAGTLYVLAVGLTLAMLATSELLRLPWAVGVDTGNPLQLVWAIVSLHQTYYLVDVLALYVLLMLVAPLVLFLLCEGRTWLVLLGSWTIWLGFQFFPSQTELPWTTAGNNLFYLSAWQALFFTAMVIGFHRQRLGKTFRAEWRVPALVLSAIAFVALIVVYTNEAAILQWVRSELASLPGPSAWSVADLEDALFGKGNVRPGRIVASSIVFAFLFALTTLAWVPVRRALGGLLLPLGENALYAYSTHIALAVVLGVLGMHGASSDDARLNAIIQIASIGLVWTAIRLRILYPTPANRRVWMASVVPVALVVTVVFGLNPSPVVDTAVAAAQATPVPDAARLARAFGTPLPRVDGASPGMQAAAASTPVVLAPAIPPVPPVQEITQPPVSEISQYVGPINGTFREISFYSASLDREMTYYIYLPPGYQTESRRYPVLYMLHGGGGNKDEWPAYGLVNDVDRSIQSKDIRPMIVVMPQGDLGYWVNWAGDGPRWGDFVARDLRRQVDATFRTLPDASHRAVGGLSMGGAGALQLAFNHPEIFSVVGAHSPSLHLDDGTFSQIYGVGADFALREPIDLANTAPNIDNLKIWIDAGEEDPWLPRDEMLNDNLGERGIAHNWTVLSGGHDGDYWIQNIPTYLRFYDSLLNGDSSS